MSDAKQHVDNALSRGIRAATLIHILRRYSEGDERDSTDISLMLELIEEAMGRTLDELDEAEITLRAPAPELATVASSTRPEKLTGKDGKQRRQQTAAKTARKRAAR